MTKEEQLKKTLLKFKSMNDRLAKKYGMKITMSIPNGPEVVLADHLNDKNNNNNN